MRAWLLIVDVNLYIIPTSYNRMRDMLLTETPIILPLVSYYSIKLLLYMLPHCHFDIESGPALEGIMHRVKFLGDTGFT